MRNHSSSFWRTLIIGMALLSIYAIPQFAVAENNSKIEIVPIIGHTSVINAVAFSPDGRFVLSGSHDQTLKLWDTSSGRLIRTFEGHYSAVESAAFSPDGTRVISGGEGKSIILWNLIDGKILRKFDGHSSTVNSLAFSSDGTRVLSGSSDKTLNLKLWDVASGRLIRTFEGHAGYVESVAFSPDGTRVLSGSSDKTLNLKLWDVASGRLIRTFEGHTGYVNSVTFSPDDTRIISGSSDKTLKLWDATTGRLIRTFEGHSNSIRSVTFSVDGIHILSGSYDQTVKLWETDSGKLIQTFTGHSRVVSSVAFAANNAYVLSGSHDNTIKLWNSANGQIIRTFKGVSDGVNSVAISADGSRLISASNDNTIKLWDVARGELVRSFKGHTDAVTSVAFSPDDTLVLSGSLDKTVKLWDSSNGQFIRTFEGHSNLISSVAFSPDGRYAISGAEESWSISIPYFNTIVYQRPPTKKSEILSVWEINSGRLIQKFEEGSKENKYVAISTDGSHVLFVQSDNSLNIWSTASGRQIGTLKKHAHITSVAISSDGKLVLTGGRGGILSNLVFPDNEGPYLWDMASGKLIRTFGGKFENFSSVTSVAFSPDGTRVLSGGTDKTVKLWETSSGKLIHTFSGHSASVTSVAFSPNGSVVISGSRDGTIRTWRTETGEQLVTLVGGHDKEWLSMTSKGFFTASNKGIDMLSIVRGLEVTSITQVFQHLYRPDLIDEMLKGDPESKHEEAARTLNLKKVLDLGPTPQIEHLQNKTERAGNTIKLAVRIIDSGGGIGSRIVWRVNGKTSGNLKPSELKGVANPNPGHLVTLTESFKLDPNQKNIIELTAYNGAGLHATPPLKINVDKFGVTTEQRPRMHVLAIGVDKYRMQDYQLNYAVKDARTFSTALDVVGSELFAKVQTTILTNEQVTEPEIASAFDRISSDADPQDVFVLFLSGHGKSIDGRYYYYPQTLDFNIGQRVKEHGIGQDKWQAWLAKVNAQKTLLILDTCESSAAGGLVRGADGARKTALDQLQHATGQNLIAASRQAAYEGYRGHGVLTYALLEALNPKEGRNRDERVKVGNLADYVDERVPAISQELFGVYQKPTRKLSGNDFPIGLRRTVLTAPEITSSILKTPTHVIIRSERVREKASETAPGDLQLAPGTQVLVVKFVGSKWALIAKGGQKLGYVPVEGLLKLVKEQENEN